MSHPSSSPGFHRYSVGALSALRSTFPEPAFGPADQKQVTVGKPFVGDALHSTSIEASVHRMLPGQGMPFFHRHRRNEEIYFVIRGRGRFILGEAEIDVQEGDFVRVDPAVERCWAAASDEELVYLCMQADQGSLKAKVTGDGELSSRAVNW